MDLGLANKRVLVTGSTAGVGLAAAKAFARERAAVTLTGRTRARVQAALDELRRELPGEALTGVAADLGTAVGVETLLGAIPEVDVLVHDVGLFATAPFEELSDAEWFRFFETNVMSGVRLCRAYLPGMLARGWGRIVFVSSAAAVRSPAETIHYGMTQAAQGAVARGLAERTAGTGVTVNSVLPGPTDPEAADPRRRAHDQGAAPDQVADMIVYVASARASATNGAALRVDGGRVREPQ